MCRIFEVRIMSIYYHRNLYKFTRVPDNIRAAIKTKERFVDEDNVRWLRLLRECKTPAVKKVLDTVTDHECKLWFASVRNVRYGSTPLEKVIQDSVAWRHNDVKMMACAIASGADVNARIEDGDTLLARARADADVGDDIIDLLLGAGADPNLTDQFGGTVLGYCCTWGDDCVDTATKLIAHGADVNARDTNGRTALMFASFYGRVRHMEALISAGASVNSSFDHLKLSPLMYAAFGSKPEAVQLLIRAGAAQDELDRTLKSITIKQWSPSNFAETYSLFSRGRLCRVEVKDGDYEECVNVLEQASRAAASMSQRERDMALITTSDSGYPSAVQQLLQAGTSESARGDALRNAVAAGRREVVLMLLAAGVSRRAKAAALTTAAQTGRLDLMDTLLGEGPTTNEVDHALFAAAEYGGTPDTISALLKHGATPNAIDSALMAAAGRRHEAPEVVAALAAAGASQEAKQQASRAAADRGHTTVAIMLGR